MNIEAFIILLLTLLFVAWCIWQMARPPKVEKPFHIRFIPTHIYRPVIEKVSLVFFLCLSAALTFFEAKTWVLCSWFFLLVASTAYSVSKNKLLLGRFDFPRELRNIAVSASICGALAFCIYDRSFDARAIVAVQTYLLVGSGHLFGSIAAFALSEIESKGS